MTVRSIIPSVVDLYNQIPCDGEDCRIADDIRKQMDWRHKQVRMTISDSKIEILKSLGYRLSHFKKCPFSENASRVTISWRHGEKK